MIKDIIRNARNDFSHLYNPRKEGIGTYDANYINAYKKANRKIKNKKTKLRYAA
tara:strand:- start:652 stop:813 length:162 start_codon:yes stop_codon:yes gene_type:complete